MNHGLEKRQLDTLMQYLKGYTDKIDKVALFGSRAKGTHREGSDIDLVLYGSLERHDANRLWTLFHESNLPYKVDVNIYDAATPSTKEQIDRHAVTLFTRQQLLEEQQ